MSVEATALSRSKLEQKDRSELAAIVEAMGGKAGSRAKKAELVELVLQLAGAVPTPAPEPSHEQSHGQRACEWRRWFRRVRRCVRARDAVRGHTGSAGGAVAFVRRRAAG